MSALALALRGRDGPLTNPRRNGRIPCRLLDNRKLGVGKSKVDGVAASVPSTRSSARSFLIHKKNISVKQKILAIDELPLYNKYMTNAEIAAKLDTLEDNAAHALANPGPAAEVQQRWTGIIANRRVMVIIRDGRVHHYEITNLDSTGVLVKTRSEAEAALA